MGRTHTCGELGKKHVGKKAFLCGWVDSIRNHGKLWFIDLRDRYGKTQIVFSEKNVDKKDLKELTLESCIGVKGEVKERKDKNKKIETGDVEVFGEELIVYGKSDALPFDMKSEDVGEEIRLKYRYLDLRKERMQKNLIVRHDAVNFIRKFLSDEGLFSGR
jgi:aspartyl-tRNA synthetase